MARSSESTESLLIGELADRTGASRRSLRHYEQRGLIRPQRSGNGYRRYDPQTVEVVQRIRSLLHLGLPLATVEALLPCALVDQLAFEPCPELRAMLRSRLERLDAAAEDLARDRAVVAAALEQADAGETWTGEPTSSTDTTPPRLPHQGYTVPKGTTHRTRAPARTVMLMSSAAGVVPTGADERGDRIVGQPEGACHEPTAGGRLLLISTGWVLGAWSRRCRSAS